MLVHKYKILSAISTVMFYLPETFAGVIDALFGLNLQWTGFFTVTSRDASLRPQDAQPQQYLGCWERADTKFSVVHVSGVIYIWPWYSSGKTKVRSCFKIFCIMNPKNKKGNTFHVAHVADGCFLLLQACAERVDWYWEDLRLPTSGHCACKFCFRLALHLLTLSKKKF